MTAYADFYYFALLLYPGLPAIVLGLTGRLRRWFIALATAAVLTVQYWEYLPLGKGTAVLALWLLAGYALYQTALVGGFAWLRRRTGRWAVYPALVLGLAPLAVAKYVPLVAPQWSLGFAGISYLTFRALDAVITLHDRPETPVAPLDFLGYLLFFPAVSSGPIDRWQRFVRDWRHTRSRAEYLDDLDGAMRRIANGFVYKFILAFLINKYWLEPAGAHRGLWWTVSYMYAYSLFLFFDFAGYSAFAVGVSYLFGVHTPENFDRPFLSRNIREFWNRWHISLSWWFRDHIYMRFVMAATRGKWFRSRYTASYLGFLLTMGLMGLWHGTAWHYILYGLYHGLLLAGFDWASRWNKQRRLWGEGLLWRWAGIAVTVQAVCFGLLIFSGRLG